MRTAASPAVLASASVLREKNICRKRRFPVAIFRYLRAHGPRSGGITSWAMTCVLSSQGKARASVQVRVDTLSQVGLTLVEGTDTVPVVFPLVAMATPQWNSALYDCGTSKS